MSFQWNGRAEWACRHGYPHGDCPMACLACEHRCELHDAAGACQAVECACPGWTEDGGGDDDDADERRPSG